MNIIEYVYLWIFMILLANRSNVSWNLNFSSTVIWSFYPILSCNFETCELPRGFSRNPGLHCCHGIWLSHHWTAPSCSAVRLTRKPNQRLKSEKKNRKNMEKWPHILFGIDISAILCACNFTSLTSRLRHGETKDTPPKSRKDCRKCQQTKQMILQQCRDKTR